MTDRDGPTADVAAGRTGAAFCDEAIPAFLEHRLQLRGIAERAADSGRMHGDD